METFSVLLALCVGNSPVTGEFPSQRPVICAWINGWLNNREAGDLRRHRAHYDVTVMFCYRPEEAVSQLFQSFETTHWLSFDVTAMKFETQNSQIPQCIRPIPHNAPFRNEMCTLLRPGENVRHFPDDDKKNISRTENYIFCFIFHWNVFVSIGLISNGVALIQVIVASAAKGYVTFCKFQLSTSNGNTIENNPCWYLDYGRVAKGI